MIRTRKYTLPFFGILFGILSIGLTAWVLTSTQSAKASDSFNAENIISDHTFTNKDSMSVGQIQNFLESKGSACLANFQTLSINDQNGDGLGDEPYGKGVGEHVSAATAIWQAAQLYRINPQVILVTLQKEQGLVTRQDCPSWRYNTALGYGCPDSEPCDQAAYGFTRQIDYGVWHFRGFFDDTYPVPPTVPGSKFIAYNPDVNRCGGRVINIQNRATAALYSYTPYQPNAATLAAPQGQLVDCGAYGNLNFWRFFTAWFGSTQYEPVYIAYKSHLSNYGWTPDMNINRGMTGSTGKNRAMEAFKIIGDVEYTSYNINTGWQPTVSNGMISGTTGLSRPIQAIKVKPTGALAQEFDLYYRVHVSNVGWMGWTKDNQPAGVTGDSRSIEAIEMQLLPKGSNTPGSTANAYQNSGTTSNNAPLALSIASHVSNVGWQPTVTDNMTTGTTEQSRQMEAIKIGLNNQTGLTGNILYSTHLAAIGWQDIKSNNEIAGTIGQGRRVEAIRILLTGQLGENYDIWYRSYIQYAGWMGWTKNGIPSGSVGASRQLEAVDIRIIPKGSPAPPQQAINLFNPQGLPAPDNYSLGYSSHLYNIGWTPKVSQNIMSGTTGQARSMEALRIDNLTSFYGNAAITCSAYVKGTGWVENITTGNTCGTTGQSKPIEAVKLSLADSANKYDLYYKVHVSWLGWQDWVKGGVVAGTPNSGKNIEAITIKLVEK